MSACVGSIVENGLQGLLVDVECHISNGLPNIIIVGFGNKAVDEAKERIRSAFANAQLDLPRKRITINLAPADLPKDGTSFDLAIASAILLASKQVLPEVLKNTLVIGELGLDGSVRPVRGVIGKLLAARNAGYNHFILPQANLAQANLIPGLTLFPVSQLRELYLHLSGAVALPSLASGQSNQTTRSKRSLSDFKDVIGQHRAKRALEIAAAGAHNILLSGPPGTGKSMLAKATSSILPPLGLEETLEITHLHSLANHQFDTIIQERPFRAPHHSASETSILGGGTHPRPGEISLSHHGVLFFDELPEFNRSTLEALRQPLEDKVITVARAKDNITFPANFILIATSNPCPCGFYGSTKACVCLPNQISRYQQKLSGPIIDRIDLYIDVDEVQHDRLLDNTHEESSKSVQYRVTQARHIQAARYQTSLKTNAVMSNRDIKQLARLKPEATSLLNTAAEKLGISARAYMRLIKVARTIADLEGCPDINSTHMAEALQYRRQTNANSF